MINKKRKKLTITAGDTYYRQLNGKIREAVDQGITDFVINDVNSQRYIATGLTGDLHFQIQGVPGQDIAAFMSGPTIRVLNNAQDGVGNTMDDGLVVVKGMAGDVIGYAMRGGRIYIKGDVGYRVGIHMKAYMEKFPIIVVGGKAGDFLGEYMAGGIILLLGMFSDKQSTPVAGRSLGTGMHGGTIYVRGELPATQIGPHLRSQHCDDEDMKVIQNIIMDYAKELNVDVQEILAESFVKVRPFSKRPYGNLYVPA